MKLYAKYPSATEAAWLSIFFEKPFVSRVKRRFVMRTLRLWRSTYEVLMCFGSGLPVITCDSHQMHTAGERLRRPRITASKPPCFQYLTAAPPQNPHPRKTRSHIPATFPTTRNPLQTNHFPSSRPVGTPFPPAPRARLRPGNSTYPPLG